MRLPPTGISISQYDLSQTLQQLEIYEGLLRQGFKGAEIATYFRQQRNDQQSSQGVSLLPKPGPAPSTVDIHRRASEKVKVQPGLWTREVDDSDVSDTGTTQEHDRSEIGSGTSSSEGDTSVAAERDHAD